MHTHIVSDMLLLLLLPLNLQQALSSLRAKDRIKSSNGAFAALLADGTVVTWGHARDGGDSSSVKGQLRDVCQSFG